MPKKRIRAEQIVMLLRQIEVLMAQGKSALEACRDAGSPTASSNPTTISSTIAAKHGTSSSTSLGGSYPSDCANGRTVSDQ